MTNRLKFQNVNIIERDDGAVDVYYQGRKLHSGLTNQTIQKENRGKIMDYKDRQLWVPSRNHPWRNTKVNAIGTSLN